MADKKTCKAFDPTPEEPKPEKMTSEQVRAALRSRFSDSRRYAIAEEVGLQTGFSHRRLDMMVLDCYASNGFRIDGIEIKVSKTDLKRELEDPEKHVAFFDVIDYFTLACPEGVADLSVIPPKWGVMLIKGNGQTRYMRKPLALHDEIERAVPRGFLASITRAIQGRQPSHEELRAEYERGAREQKEAYERRKGYMQVRLEQEAEKLEKYDALQRRFRLWGDDADEKLDQFEAFRKLPLDYLIPRLEQTSTELKELAVKLQGA